MHGDDGFDADHAALSCGGEGPMATADAEFRGINVAATLPTEIFDPTSDPRVRDQQMGLPLLDSNPGAPVTLYLDFNGNFESDWWQNRAEGERHYSNVLTPVFDMDGSTIFFNATERAVIKEVWARVAEDFAPFNINVSTAYYGGFNDGQALRVAIGGHHTDWLNRAASGTSSIGSFSDSAPNVVFVFDLVAAANSGHFDSEGRPLVGPSAMASTISHEAGHSFGLRHHSRWAVDGSLIDTYDTGNAGWTPIMGSSLSDDRTTWDSGPTDLGPDTSQSDVEVLADPKNVFGLRADDHGNSVPTASSLATTLYVFATKTGKGIIGDMNDVDFFRFTTPGGPLKVQVDPAVVGPNLIPVAELWSASGFVAKANAGGIARSIIDANVGAGTYYVRVKGFGDYGDMGQYTVSVTHQPLTTTADTGTSSGGVLQPKNTLSLPATVVRATPQRSLALQASAVAAFGQSPVLADPSSQKVLAASRVRSQRHDAVFAMMD